MCAADRKQSPANITRSTIRFLSRTGMFADIAEAAEHWVKIKAVYYPDSEKETYYRKKYEAYKKLIDNLSGVWKDVDLLSARPAAPRRLY